LTSKTDFKDMYEGGDFIKRLKAFISSPLELNQFYDSSVDVQLISKWLYPFEETCRNSMVVQREILFLALHKTTSVVEVLEELSAYFRRLPDFLDVIGRSENPNVPSPTLTEEKDLQVLIGAQLRMLYDDVRPEDYVSQFAGANSRVDFLIRGVGVIVETKMTRPSLTDKRVGEELLIDWGRYQRHPDCKGIFALVYDPSRRLSNPTALESDLSGDNGGLWTRVLVVR
jgi:hypothetical protein